MPVTLVRRNAQVLAKRRVMFVEEHHALFSLIALGYRVVYTPYAVIRHPYPQTVKEIHARNARGLTVATGYLTMLLVEEPSYRWATLKYVIEGAWGKPRKWRAQIPMSPFRILTLSHRLAACLSGPLLYGASRLFCGFASLRHIEVAERSQESAASGQEQQVYAPVKPVVRTACPPCSRFDPVNTAERLRVSIRLPITRNREISRPQLLTIGGPGIPDCHRTPARMNGRETTGFHV